MTNISIVGLEKIGCSLALALKASGETFRIIGLDRDAKTADLARQTGALDLTTKSLAECLANAAFIFLATPVDEIQDTLLAIQPLLKPGMVVVDTSIVLATSTSWAPSLIPAGCSLLALTPALNPAMLVPLPENRCEPDPDLFRNSVMALTTAPGASALAVDMVSHLVKLIGASVWLADPQEAASMFAAVHLFPQLLAAAGMHTLFDQPSWEDARRLAGSNLLGLSGSLQHLDEREKPGEAIMLQRKNLIRLLENASQNLQAIRQILEVQDAEALQSLLKESNAASSHWWQQRSQNNWGEVTTPPAPRMGDILKSLIRFGPRKEKK